MNLNIGVTLGKSFLIEKKKHQRENTGYQESH